MRHGNGSWLLDSSGLGAQLDSRLLGDSVRHRGVNEAVCRGVGREGSRGRLDGGGGVAHLDSRGWVDSAG